MFHLPEHTKTTILLKPAADAAGRTGRYVSLKDAVRAWIIVTMDQGNAATVALTPKQATAVAGTGVKNLVNAVPVWACLDVATSDALARATDATSYTTDAGVKEKVVVFQIETAALDVSGGFDCITVATGASNAANITSAVIVVEERYRQVTPPTILTD
jgi:hypothetical protein